MILAWFYVNNWLENALPPDHNLAQKLLRRAFIGFAASIASDTVSNSLRVVKTYRQVNNVRISYSSSFFLCLGLNVTLSLSPCSECSPRGNSYRRNHRLVRERAEDENFGEWMSERYVLDIVEMVHGHVRTIL